MFNLTNVTDNKTGLDHFKRVFIVSMGCSRRRADVAWLAKYFEANGWEIVEEIQIANLILVYTCGFCQEKEDMSISAILQVTEFKRSEARVIVCGCLPKINPQRLSGVFQGEVLLPRELNRIDDIINESIKLSQIEEANVIINDYLYPPAQKEMEIPGFTVLDITTPVDQVYNLMVAKGCLSRCSFCAIKFAMGKLESKPLDRIIYEFKNGLAKGYKIFVLVGEDIGAYGIDIGTNVVELLKRILEVEGDYKIRIVDFNMEWIMEYLQELKMLFKKYKDKMDIVMIPVQSGSNKILRLMNRQYTIEDVNHCFKEIGKEIPGFKIFTHVMIGFPGESEDDFKATLRFMASYPFVSILIYGYSDRPNTASSRLSEKVPEKAKMLRIDKAYALLNRLCSINNLKRKAIN